MQLEVKHIKKTYNGKTEALKDASFSVEKGSFVSLLGLSGAGKSTLLHVINGSLKADGGEVYVDGQCLTSARGKKLKAIQKTIGCIYQDFCLVENSTVLQNVLNACLGEMGLGAGLLGLFGAQRNAKALQLLESVGLADKAGERVRNLSGGQKQRVAIARALMQDPSIILADEPVASLDPVTGRQILEILKSLQTEKGISVLMNCHSPETAAEFSDRIIGLAGGCIVFDGAASDLTQAVLTDIYKGDPNSELNSEETAE